MEWSDVGKQLVELGAPLVGGLLGGPGGAAVGAGISTLLGVPSHPADVADKLLTDSHAIIELKKYEIQNRSHLADLEVEHAKIDLENVKNARQRPRTDEDRAMMVFLAISVVGLIFANLAGLFFLKIPTGICEVLTLIIGSILSKFDSIINFFFASSSGSRKKDKIYEQLMGKNTT